MGHPTDYEAYVHTDVLFSAMKPAEDLTNHDERVFQTTHQAAELWMRVVADEIGYAVERMAKRELAEASKTFRRAAMIERHISDSLRILETMPPAHYQQIRVTLGRGSGSESPGFRYLLAEVAPPVAEQYEAILQENDVSIFDIWMDPEGKPVLHELTASIIDFDQAFQEFRYHHMNLARREIGLEVMSLKDVPAEILKQGATEPLFEDLWEAINEVTRTFRPDY